MTRAGAEARPGEPAPLVPPTTESQALSPVAARTSPLCRLVRNRTVRAAAVTGLVGVLLGAGTVAWQTETLALLKPAPGWDSLGDTAVSALFGDRRLKVEQELLLDPRTASLSYGQCRRKDVELNRVGGEGGAAARTCESGRNGRPRIRMSTIGPVVMVVDDVDLVRADADFVRDLLPAYVEAESERIGCGPGKVKLPAP